VLVGSPAAETDTGRGANQLRSARGRHHVYTSRRVRERSPDGIVNDEEIAEWIRANQLSAKDKVALTRAIADLKRGPITGVIRTALREKEGLPPVPGDDS